MVETITGNHPLGVRELIPLDGQAEFILSDEPADIEGVGDHFIIVDQLMVADVAQQLSLDAASQGATFFALFRLLLGRLVLYSPDVDVVGLIF